MNRLFITIIVILSFSLIKVFGQELNHNYSEVDSFAKHLEYPGSLAILVESLTKNYTEDELKARSIFSWIAFHIEYDFEGLKDHSILKTGPEGVIENGKTICQGYANLYKELCTLADLECEIITGWGRNSSRDIGKRKPTNHAWNAVKINGSWRLVDATWGSGFGRRNKFVQEFDETYFFTPPNKMILNHYPEQLQWLLGLEFSKEEFDNTPLYLPPYLTMDISNLNRSFGFLKPKLFGKTKFEFEFKGQVKNIIVSGSGKQRETKSLKFKHKNDIVTFKFKVKKKFSRYSIYLNNEGIIMYRTTISKK